MDPANSHKQRIVLGERVGSCGNCNLMTGVRVQSISGVLVGRVADRREKTLDKGMEGEGGDWGW